MIVRVSAVRFHCIDKNDCFRELIDSYLTPYYDKYVQPHFSEFRRIYMIGTTIDNLLFVNKQAFVKLFQECCTMKNFGSDRLDFFA